MIQHNAEIILVFSLVDDFLGAKIFLKSFMNKGVAVLPLFVE
jgi:hypothetical protein